MDSWPTSYEIEKPKPIKARAACVADRLDLQITALRAVFTSGNDIPLVHALRDAVEVLRDVAAGKRV